jgi:Cu-Zn family superoxide dismutase
MKHRLSRKAGAVGILLSALAVAALLGTGPISAKDKTGARALLRNSAGGPVGVAKLTEEKGKVLVRVTVHDLAPGFHGLHVHAVGSCLAPSFLSAGGHFNPSGDVHGDHAGDLPILLVNADGTGEARFKTDRFKVSELFDADGSAVIVHASADNYANIPTRYHSHAENTAGPDSATLATGDSGSRVACGVVGRDVD